VLQPESEGISSTGDVFAKRENNAYVTLSPLVVDITLKDFDDAQPAALHGCSDSTKDSPQWCAICIKTQWQDHKI